MKIVNILEEEDWVPEPALRPEDELMLRKLQDMLQSTAADLKALSDELTNNREQTKLDIVVPLDNEFNNKIHIEEIVNAKFHGKKALQKPSNIATAKEKFSTVIKDVIAENFVQRQKVTSTAVQVNTIPIKNSESILKKTSSDNLRNMELQNTIKDKEIIVPLASYKSKPCQAVIYNEVTHEYTDQPTQSPRQVLNIQVMPSINIRSALTEQKLAQINIHPEINLEKQHLVNKNSAVIEVSQSARVAAKSDHLLHDNKKVFVNRKTYKMSTCDSSDTSNSIKRQREVNIGKSVSTKTFSEIFKKKSSRKVSSSHPSHPRPNIEEWRKKLSAVYSTSNNKASKIPTKQNISLASKSKQTAPIKPKEGNLNNIDYIPYSKLTLGGASVAEVEQRLSRSRKNSHATLNATRSENIKCEGNVQKGKGELKVLTTSDENLLQVVLDVEKKINKTILKKEKCQPTESNYVDSDSEEENGIKNEPDNVSYEDDFEDEDKSNPTSDAISNQTNASGDGRKVINIDHGQRNSSPKNVNLSLKDTIDVFEYVHFIDTQDNTTQSNHLSNVAIKEAQTSPQSSSALPIHNNLWPTIDPKGEVEKLFNLEKDFIKKLILEEYGDLLEKNVSKPSSSKVLNDFEENRTRNLAAAQKNTQTSPARVKSSMTSPTRTKTRTTSPFPRPDFVNRDTSPFDVASDDPGISINLSSPRFSLRLPQTSTEALSNMEHYSSNKYLKDKTFTKEPTHHSSSADMEASSSDLSSLGEVKLKIRRKNVTKYRPSTLSESSSATSTSTKYTEEIVAGVVPLRSEGELSLGRLHSEGEVNLHYL